LVLIGDVVVVVVVVDTFLFASRYELDVRPNLPVDDGTNDDDANGFNTIRATYTHTKR
jgi:hypothetical protein